MSFETYTGTIYEETLPPQGCNIKVTLLSAERGRFVVKSGDTPEKVTVVEREAEVLQALAAYQPFVPFFLAREGNDFLFTYVEGTDAATEMAQVDPQTRMGAEIIDEYGQALRKIQRWHVPEFPLPSNWIEEAVQSARANVAVGLVETPLGNFAGSLRGRDTRELAESLPAWRERLNLQDEIVFSHGDYCLPNVLLEDNAVSGVIDWSAGGWADRRFDIATALLSLDFNGLGWHYTTFLQACGNVAPIEELRFFQALYLLL